MMTTLNTIASILATRSTFVLTTHVNPDGDGIGSVAALASALREAGKSATIINHSHTPAVYDFLDPERSIRVYDPARDRELLLRADVILVLDTSQPERLRSMATDLLASPAVKICIDHHLDPDGFADHAFIDSDATSTGELVYRLLCAWTGEHLSPPVATALYTAIMTDTGAFRYPRVDPEIFRISAHLIECGADPVQCYSRVYERWTDGRIRLLGAMLAGLRTTAGGAIASVSITRKMLADTGTVEEDTDNFTTFPMSIAGVRIGILFLELSDGVKISFRSRDAIPANLLAREFGGNGHLNAAGARVSPAILTDLEARVLSAATKYV
jgi:bifunctional oligoribonuclease and PAP phosphatase NrnA